jgi:hypothetical protein
MPLYEVAVVQTPTVREEEEGKIEKLVMPPTPIIAEDQQSAALNAIMSNPDAQKIPSSRRQVLVRPFV